jgi:hypothetical protein
MTTFFLIYISFDYWNKLQHNPQIIGQVGFTSEDILRKVVNRAFFLVTLMYLVFVLIDKTVFVISSVLAMLYFGNDILKSLNLVTESTKTEKKFMLNMAFFNLASFLWFKMSNITTGVSYGFPDLPTSSVLQGDIVSWITTWITFLFNMLFFTIPEIPSVLNLFIKGLQFVSIGMFVLYLVSLIPVANIDTGN